MKLTFLFAFFSVFLLIASLLSSENVVLKKNRVFSINAVSGIFHGGAVGIGKTTFTETRAVDTVFYLHYRARKNNYLIGFYGQISTYRNKQRTGFFTLVTGGLDYHKGESLFSVGSIGGSNDDKPPKVEGIMPNIAVGLGYSFALSDKVRMPVFIDLGLRRFIASINMGVTF
jgi:hypothetical protein